MPDGQRETGNDKRSVAILAYGSLIANPGPEIESATIGRKDRVLTPFNVEFARTSTKRSGAPTLIPFANGARVPASLIILNVSESDATDRLYRREINQIGSGKRYDPPAKPGPNTVVIKRIEHFEQIDIVLYAEIAPNILGLDAATLACLAIRSATELADSRDGISYLIAAKAAGIETPLSSAYEDEIKRRTGAASLEEALRKARELGRA